jgi:hypothetical protein
MGVKKAGEKPMTREEILKMVDKHKAIEQSKLYNKSHIWTMDPPFNYAVKDTMAFAPFYPEMNEVGYNHKVHGNNVVPDYRVYQTERTASVSPSVKDYIGKLEKADLKDPWLRNELWRTCPYNGYRSNWGNFKAIFGPGMLIGAGLALVHFALKTAYESVYPPAPHVVDEWWKLRETPEPNIIKNRIEPIRMQYSLFQVSRNPWLSRVVKEEYGVVQPPVLQWYKKEDDPALVGLVD